MTRGKFFFIVLMAAAVLCAIFVWPTRYRDLNERADADGVMRSMRVDRWSERVEIQTEAGDWIEFAPPPPEYDARETHVGQLVGKTDQAEKDIRKMNEVVNDATKHSSPIK